MAAKRLTNYDRDVIVRAIFGDIPDPDDDAIAKGAQASLLKAMAPEVRRLYTKRPKALAVESPDDVFHRRHVYLVVADLTDDEKDAALAPWREARQKYKEARSQLRAVVYSCRTHADFERKLPEFVAYLPKDDVATPNLPAVTNLVADLVKLGWKGAAK